MTYRDGDRFEGEYVRDRRQGQGVYNFQVNPRARRKRMAWLGNDGAVTLPCFPGNDTQNGDVYDGAWVDHDRTGKGVFLGKDGARYEGWGGVRKGAERVCF